MNSVDIHIVHILLQINVLVKAATSTFSRATSAQLARNYIVQ